jgi:hydroxymethylpyrimidine/phosphomethylpyrimidine kinase
MDQLNATDCPIVLSINSHDPSGGAGLAADIETIASLGGHCVSAVTALNVRDTQDMKDRHCCDAALLIEQIRAALEDTPVRAVKVGDLGSVAQVEAVHTILTQYTDLPVILDPVLHHATVDGDLAQALRMLLLPLASLTILSLDHVDRLANASDSLQACTQELFEYGGEYLLMTDTARSAGPVLNRLFSRKGISQEYRHERLPHTFHGAGSTLSAAVTTYLAHGIDLMEAVQQGQQFTAQALAHAHRTGMGCLLPDRLFWSRHHQP